MIPERVAAWLQQHGHGRAVARGLSPGGRVVQGQHLETESEARFFLKTNSEKAGAKAPADMFGREAEGLAALAAAAQLRTPQVFLIGEDFLLMEDLQPGRRAPNYWEALGRGLARLHGHTKPKFGFDHDNYIGLTPQPNPWSEDGYAFFAEQRLGYQVRLAGENRLLEPEEAAAIRRLAARLPQLLPPQPASLLHGDLWAGNALADAHGAPALIDPAAHYGWAEAELGMTALFGGFPGAFYAAYEAERPLEADWRQRLPLYNLYHLLNHLNLFGRGYYGQVMEIVKKW